MRNARARKRQHGTLQAIAWGLLALFTVCTLRVLILCSGPCCEPHVALSFGPRLCCADTHETHHTEEAVASKQRAPRSCCSSAAAHENTLASPSNPEERDSERGDRLAELPSCCISAPLVLDTVPLPASVTWKWVGEVELSTTPRFALLREALYPAPLPARTERLRGGGEPPPLYHLKATLASTLLRI